MLNGFRWAQKPPVGTSIDRDQPYADGMSAFWAINEGAGPVIRDVSGAAAPGTFSGGVTWAPGRSGCALQFDGSTGLVEIPSSVLSPSAGTLIVSAWIDPAGSSTQAILGFYENDTGNSFDIQLWGGSVNFGWSKSGADSRVGVTGSVAWPSGSWVTYALTWETGGATNAYVNGILSASRSPTTTFTPTVPLLLGCEFSGTNFKGLIDYLFVSDRAMSAPEIAAFGANPWQMFAPRSYFRAVPAIVPELTAGAPVYANGTQQVVPLTAFDHTLAVGSSPFLISGTAPAGVSMAAQAVTSATQASVTLDSGTATGSLSITDGTATATIPVIAPSITITPSIIPADHPGHITLTLTGEGTLWSQGTTTFSLESGASVSTSIIGWTITSTTSAILTVATGAGAGTATFTDGHATGSVEITVPSFSVTVQTPATVATGIYLIALYSQAAVWTQEAPSTLFEVSGWSGASISDISVSDDHNATAILTLGSTTWTGGSATIVDHSTGATTAIAVQPAFAGSLRATGTATLAHSGGTANLLAKRTSASFAFRFRVNSLDLPVPSSPVCLLSWSHNGDPLATYYPATGQVVFRFASVPDANGNYYGITSASIAVQPCVDYHILGSWSPTAQSIYLNGALLATSTTGNGMPTEDYSGLLIGPSTGDPGQIDINISDVAIWPSYAATVDDASAIASNSASPIGIKPQPAAWWPLGGGTTGATPAIGDAALSDLTGNGNNLYLGSGLLSSLSYAAAIGATAPFLRSDWVSKSGKLANFGMTSSYTVPGAQPRVAPIVAVNGTPTIYRGPHTISIGPATGTVSSAQDLPLISYLLLCGAVDRIAIEDGGEGYTAPTASWVTGSGSGTSLTLGTPIIATGVATYGITNAGVGWSGTAPSASVMPTPTGWNTGTATPIAATIRTEATSGSLTTVVPGAGGLLGCGSGYTIGETITLSIGTGSGAQLTPTWSNGGLQSVAVTTGGSNYPANVWVVPVDPAGTGSGAILTAMVSNNAIQSITVVAGGSGYSVDTTFAIVPAWTFTGSTTSGSATIDGIASGTPIFAGQGIYGPGIPAGATAATGTAFIGTVTESSTQITNCSSTAGITVGDPITGTGIPNGTTITAISVSTVTMSAGANGGASGAPTPIVAMNINAINLSASAATSATSVSLTAYNPTAIWARVGNYIQSVPIVSSSDDFTGPPSFIITDNPAPARTATLLPLMSGVSAGDVITYDAPGNWITPTINGAPLGGVGAVNGQPIVNGTGVNEPASGGLSAFAQPLTMAAGVNEGGQHIINFLGDSPLRNKAYNWYWAVGSAGASGPAPTLTFDSAPVSMRADSGTGGVPASWTYPSNAIVQKLAYGPWGSSNNLDGMGQPSQVGQWGLIYSDSNVNTSDATWVNVFSFFGTNNYVNQSGPNVGQPAGTGAVIDPRDIVIANGVIQSIGITYSSLGSGYEGVLVVVGKDHTYNPNIYPAVTANVSNGIITGFNVICGGEGYYGTPTITVFGTKVAGNTVTIINNIQYKGTLETVDTWSLYILIGVAAASGRWTISDPVLMPPDPVTGEPQTYDPALPFQADANFLAALTTGSGRTTACVRYMTATEGYGGNTNTIYSSDLLNPKASDWQTQQQINLTLAQARCFNADPNSTVYSWSSTKVYGPQAIFAETEPSFTITGTMATGSADVTNVSGAALMAGSTVTGPGIPLGPQGQSNYISLLSPGGTGFRLAYAATETGTATLTVTNPPHFSLSPDDIGEFLAPNFYNNTAVEMVTAEPHGLTSMQAVWISPGAVPIPIEGYGPSRAGAQNYTVFVTGPYSFVFRYPRGVRSGFSRVASVSPIDLTAGGHATTLWTAMTTWPCQPNTGTAAMPYDATAQISAGLPGSALWRTIPPCATDEVVAEIARIDAANLGPSNTVLLEYGNELWNFDIGPETDIGRAAETAIAATPPGQSAYDGYTSDGTRPPEGGWYPEMCALLGDHLYKVYEAAWVAAGRSASAVKRIQGAWYTSASQSTNLALEAIARAGSHTDHVCIAPYMDTTPDPSVIQAFAPAGSLAGAASWPIDAIADFTRNWLVYGAGNQSPWRDHNIACRNFGQPQTPLSFVGAATATAILTPTTIASVAIINGNSGVNYSAQTTAKLYGGGGPVTAITPVVSGGTITGFTGLPKTANWTSIPWVSINDPTGAGSGAMAVATLTPTSVASLAIKDPGVGYGQPGATEIQVLIGAPASGTTAQAGTITFAGSGIAEIAVADGGTGYTDTPQVSIYGGGVLPATYFNCAYTFVDGSGNETTVGLSRTTFYTGSPGNGATVNANLIVVRSPSLPAWASAVNFYIGNGQPGSETLYMTVSRSEWVAANGRIAFNQPAPAPTGQRAPLTCGVPVATIGTIPTVVTYEGSVEKPIPDAVPFQSFLGHDLMSHSSCRDMIRAWHVMCQQGDQSLPAPGGAVLSNYFVLFSPPSYNHIWELSPETHVPAGDGTSNQFATIQGGAPADAHDHWGGLAGYSNVSPALQALKDWIDVTSPLSVQPVNPSPRKRRWFSGLGQRFARPAK